jgi:hypothetical protein
MIEELSNLERCALFRPTDKEMLQIKKQEIETYKSLCRNLTGDRWKDLWFGKYNFFSADK